MARNQRSQYGSNGRPRSPPQSVAMLSRAAAPGRSTFLGRFVVQRRLERLGVQGKHAGFGLHSVGQCRSNRREVPRQEVAAFSLGVTMTKSDPSESELGSRQEPIAAGFVGGRSLEEVLRGARDRLEEDVGA